MMDREYEESMEILENIRKERADADALRNHSITEKVAEINEKVTKNITTVKPKELLKPYFYNMLQSSREYLSDDDGWNLEVLEHTVEQCSIDLEIIRGVLVNLKASKHRRNMNKNRYFGGEYIVSVTSDGQIVLPERWQEMLKEFRCLYCLKGNIKGCNFIRIFCDKKDIEEKDSEPEELEYINGSIGLPSFSTLAGGDKILYAIGNIKSFEVWDKNDWDKFI